MTRRWNGWGDDGDRDHDPAPGHRAPGGHRRPGSAVAGRAPRRRRRCGPGRSARRPPAPVDRPGGPRPARPRPEPPRLDRAPQRPARTRCPMRSGDRRHRPRSATCSILPGRPAPRSSPTAAARTSSAGCRRPSSAADRPDPPITWSTSSGPTRLRRLDEPSGLATFGAGITGPALEAALRPRGRLLGHEPQSWEYSTLGGWVATRSSGQRSLGVRSDRGPVRRRPDRGTGRHARAPAAPRSAAGPDLRQIVLGSEGRLGIVAEATVRTVPIPDYDGRSPGSSRTGSGAWRSSTTSREARLPLAMIRLSTPAETRTTLAWPAGNGGSGWRCAGPGGAARRRSVPAPARRSPAGPGSPRRPAGEASKIVRKQGGVTRPTRSDGPGDANRFRGPTCATRCGMRATPPTRSRPPPTGAGPRSSPQRSGRP